MLALRKALFAILKEYVHLTKPHPGRGFIGKLAWKIYPHEFVGDVGSGISVRVRLDSSSDLMCWTRSFEDSGDAAAFVSLLREGMTIMDIGANVGLYSLLAARRIGPTGKVISFEPLPHLLQRLKENAELNAVNNIVPHSLAIAECRGTAVFHLGNMDSMGSLHVVGSRESILVQTETIDEFMCNHDLQQVDAVKVDVEGGELGVIRGMDRLLRRHRPLLMVEIFPLHLVQARTSAQELYDTIVSYGYKGHVIRHATLQPTSEPVPPSRRGFGISFDNYIFLPAD